LCVPQHVHVAFGGDPAHEIVVSYFTLEKSNTSTVQYGTSPGKYPQSTIGYEISYLHSDDDDEVFYNHHVLLEDLEPDTLYYYRTGDNYGGWSPEYYFRTAPLEQTAANFSVIVYGDMGIANSQHTVERIRTRVHGQEIDFIFHIGDISYADDYSSGMYESVWNAWFTEMEDITSITPYMVTPGNHEYSCEHEGCDYSFNFTAYNHRFRMPGIESGSNTSMFYSFDYADAHFIAVSTETDFPHAPEGTARFGNQLKWLKNDLEKANANRDNVPWIVVGGHRPIYSSAGGYSEHGIPIEEAHYLQEAMEALFYEHNVDLVVVGHVHSYERMYPTYHNKRVSTSYYNAGAPTYIVAGCAGNTEGLYGNFTHTPEWSAFRTEKDYGYGLMNIFEEDGKNVLHWKFYYSSTDELADEIKIVKD